MRIWWTEQASNDEALRGDVNDTYNYDQKETVLIMGENNEEIRLAEFDTHGIYQKR